MILSSFFGIIQPAWSVTNVPEFSPCSPASEYVEDTSTIRPSSNASLGFCADWNPEFANNHHHCCARMQGPPIPKRLRNRCDPQRRKYSYCDEMTVAQKLYIESAGKGKYGDLLHFISSDLTSRQAQAYCDVNNGFLAYGRPLVPTPENRVKLRAAIRCTYFGTDLMIGMLEWLGRQVKQEYASEPYQGIHLLMGDIAAPRGGCLSGRSGRRGHKSHTTGEDADVGYLTVRAGHDSPEAFHRQFDPGTNWWLIKKIFSNPFACVKVIFLDRRNIRKLAKFARSDEEWPKLQRFIRHVPGHRDHMHVRIGDIAGGPGCGPNAHPENETDDEGEAGEGAEGAEGSGGD